MPLAVLHDTSGNAVMPGQRQRVLESLGPLSKLGWLAVPSDADILCNLSILISEEAIKSEFPMSFTPSYL